LGVLAAGLLPGQAVRQEHALLVIEEGWFKALIMQRKITRRRVFLGIIIEALGEPFNYTGY
jgi:hypothetical protein